MPMRTIEAPSEELAKALHSHLLEKKIRGSVYSGTGEIIEFPENMSLAQWLGIVGVVEKWARGRELETVQSLRVQKPPEPEELVDDRPASAEDTSKLEAEAKKKVDDLSSDKAEERYIYLSNKPLTELTDQEFQERLLLAQRTTGKKK